METDAALFELSTEVAPAKTFIVDADEYRFLNFDHLGKTDEARIMSLFAKHSRLTDMLNYEKNTAKSERIALALRDNRMELICSLTDLPRSIAEKLPMSGQVKLLTFIRKEVSGDNADGDDDDIEGGGDIDDGDDDL